MAFASILVNARQVKNVPGRKSDVLDCQWLQQLMSYRLLEEGAFGRQTRCVCCGRWRAIAKRLLQEQARQVQRMQKSLVQMSLQLTEVLTDVVGQTGQAIFRAIVAGERDPSKLARLRHRRVKADEQGVARALQGNWREEHLFVLSLLHAHQRSGLCRPRRSSRNVTVNACCCLSNAKPPDLDCVWFLLRRRHEQPQHHQVLANGFLREGRPPRLQRWPVVGLWQGVCHALETIPYPLLPAQSSGRVEAPGGAFPVSAGLG